MSERLIEAEHQEPRRRARSGGSRATSATTGSSEDGSSGQHADYDTEVSYISINMLDQNIYNTGNNTCITRLDININI